VYILLIHFFIYTSRPIVAVNEDLGISCCI